MGSFLLSVIWVVHWTSMVCSVNDIPLVSMVKYTDASTIWSDEPRNKNDPGFTKLGITVLCTLHVSATGSTRRENSKWRTCHLMHVSQIVYGVVGFRRGAPVCNSAPLVPLRTYSVLTVSQNLNLNHL